MTAIKAVQAQYLKESTRAVFHQVSAVPAHRYSRDVVFRRSVQMKKLPKLIELGIKETETSEPLPDSCLSVNAYLGASGIVTALEQGADIVITGRCVDSAMVLAPLMHEFDWSVEDYDLLSAGSLAGHIIECGAQCTGGNFTDWKMIDGFDDMGFPIAVSYTHLTLPTNREV